MNHLRLTLTAAILTTVLAGCSRPVSVETPTPTSPSTTTPLGSTTATSTTPSSPSLPTQTVASKATALPRGLATGLPTADPASPDSVAKAFLQTVHTWDCRTDEGPNAGGRRAIPLADPQLAAAFKDARSDHGPDAQWRTMCSHDGYTTVTLGPGGIGAPPADTEHLARRAFTVTLTYHSADNTWTQESKLGPWLVTMARQPGNRWAVNTYKGV